MTITKEKTNLKQEFYTCKYDAMFKSVFIDEENPRLLEAVLSCILGGNPRIISWPNTFILNDTSKEKSKTRDLVVELDGTYINLEVVTGHGRETRSQLFTYHISMWKKNILQGEKYDTKTQFLQIVLQFGLSPNKPIMREYKMQSLDKETKEVSVWVENFKTIEVNMERLKKLWYDNSSKDIEKYKYLMMIDMNEQELVSLRNLRGSDDILEEYADKVNKLNRNLNFINDIGKEKEKEYVFNTAVDLAREEGIEQGIEQGVEQNQQETVKNMMENGFDKEMISKCINLPIPEVEKIIDILNSKKTAQ